MMLPKFVLVAAFAIFQVHAQAGGTTSNSTINPNDVDASKRSSWCAGEINTCGTLCEGDTSANTCDTATLEFECTCASNNSSPGLEYYTQTIPSFICQEIYANCIQRGANNAAAQKLCNSNEKTNCGHLNPDDFTATPATTSSSDAAATSESTDTSPTPTDTQNASPVLKASCNVGIGMLLAAAFGYVL